MVAAYWEFIKYQSMCWSQVLFYANARLKWFQEHVTLRKWLHGDGLLFLSLNCCWVYKDSTISIHHLLFFRVKTSLVCKFFRILKGHSLRDNKVNAFILYDIISNLLLLNALRFFPHCIKTFSYKLATPFKFNFSVLANESILV